MGEKNKSPGRKKEKRSLSAPSTLGLQSNRLKEIGEDILDIIALGKSNASLDAGLWLLALSNLKVQNG